MNILIIQLYRLGDVLQTTPVIKGLKQKYVNSKIYFLTTNDAYPLLKNNPYITKIFIIDRKKIKKKMKNNDLISPLENLYDLISNINFIKYDLAINLTFDKLAGSIFSLINAKEKRGIEYINNKFNILDKWSKYLFAIINNRKLNLLNIVDIFRLIAGVINFPSLIFTTTDIHNDLIRQKFLNFPKGKIIAIQSSASKSDRTLPSDYIKEIINQLIEKKYNIILLGSKGEEHDFLDLNSTYNFKNLIGKTNLMELVGIIKNVDLLISPDTLPIHIASAFSKKTITYFYGNAYPYETAPYNSEAIILYKDLMCFPCKYPNECSTKICRYNFTPDFIVEISEKFLNDMKIKSNNIKILKPGIDKYLYFNAEDKTKIKKIIEFIDLTSVKQKTKIKEKLIKRIYTEMNLFEQEFKYYKEINFLNEGSARWI